MPVGYVSECGFQNSDLLDTDPVENEPDPQPWFLINCVKNILHFFLLFPSGMSFFADPDPSFKCNADPDSDVSKLIFGTIISILFSRIRIRNRILKKTRCPSSRFQLMNAIILGRRNLKSHQMHVHKLGSQTNFCTVCGKNFATLQASNTPPLIWSKK